MSISNKHIVDIVSIDKENVVVLTISDHLEWDLENKHLFILQEKINTYLSFIETGEIFESYPSAKGKQLFRISLALKYPPNEDGIDFLRRIKSVLAEAKYEFSYSVISSTSTDS